MLLHAPARLPHFQPQLFRLIVFGHDSSVVVNVRKQFTIYFAILADQVFEVYNW
jgi:hypothetical protein